MRLADLIGSDVLDATGRELGRVGDVWLVQDGPPTGVFGAGLRVDALVIGRFGLASRAGYERDDVRGPAPIAWFLRRRTAHRQIASWSEIAAIEEGRIRLRVRDDDLARPRHHGEPAAGRRISAGLELLDRQLVDPAGKMAGKVDDVALRLGDGGGPPIVTDILAGPGALARRLGGRLGAWVASVNDRIRDSDEPASISFAIVAAIDDHVTLAVPREELATYPVERWVREHVIEKLPGS